MEMGIVIVGVLAVLTAVFIIKILRQPDEILITPELVDDEDDFWSDKGRYAKKALLIAINEYPEYGKLYGCLNDAYDIMRFLMYSMNISPLPPIPKSAKKSDLVGLAITLKKYGLQVALLIDEEATSANYRKAVEWLYRDVQQGDLRLRAYSGHGTPTPDLSGIEADGLNETLAMYDFDWDNPATWITDDEWWKPVQNLPDNVNDITWFDCCHPDSGLRSLMKKTTTRPRTIQTPEFMRDRYAKAYSSGKRSRSLPNGVLCLAGASENQTSADATFEVDGKSRKNGAFTKAMLLQLFKNRHDSVMNIVARSSEWLKTNGFEQTPQIAAAQEDRKHKPLL